MTVWILVGNGLNLSKAVGYICLASSNLLVWNQDDRVPAYSPCPSLAPWTGYSTNHWHQKIHPLFIDEELFLRI